MPNLNSIMKNAMRKKEGLSDGEDDLEDMVDSEDSEEVGEDDYSTSAEEILKAITDGDAKSLKIALESFVEMCMDKPSKEEGLLIVGKPKK